MNVNRTFFLAQGLGLAVFAACQAVAWIWPGMKMALFCGPAATLGSLFLGVRAVGVPRGWHLLHERYDVFVVESCSGFDFFALLLSVMFALAFRHSERGWTCWLAGTVAAYLVTIAANTARIICSVHARIWSDAMPISLPAEAIHFGVGTAIFASVLVASCHLVRLLYASHTRRSSF